MKRTVVRCALAWGALSVLGCTSYSAGIPAGPGKAYVIQRQGSNESMLLCEAGNRKPVCTKQTETE